MDITTIKSQDNCYILKTDTPILSLFITYHITGATSDST